MSYSVYTLISMFFPNIRVNSFNKTFKSPETAYTCTMKHQTNTKSALWYVRKKYMHLHVSKIFKSSTLYNVHEENNFSFIQINSLKENRQKNNYDSQSNNLKWHECAPYYSTMRKFSIFYIHAIQTWPYIVILTIKCIFCKGTLINSDQYCGHFDIHEVQMSVKSQLNL